MAQDSPSRCVAVNPIPDWTCHESGSGPHTLSHPLGCARRNNQTPLVEVEFRVDGRRSGDVNEEPFKRRLRARLLRASPKPLIEATGELVDGRLRTASDKIKICR